MSNTTISPSGGVGFTGLLTLLFIFLKLVGKIDWSWWWVTSPLWISFSIILLIALVAGAVILLHR